MLLEKNLGIVAALADAFALIGIPRAGFFNHTTGHTKIDQLTHLGNAFTIHDVEFHHLKRRRHLVLDHFDAGLVAHHFFAVLDGTDAADIKAHRGIELQGIAARRRLGGTKHHTNLHADLVDENHHAIRFGDGTRELAQSLAHQAGLQAGE